MNQQKQAAKKFREYWMFNRPGSERSGCQQYWNMLLRELLGQTELESVIRYEVPVQLKGSTKFLDAWIPSTRVLIEQKSRGVKLDAPQSGHDDMTPFEQAKFYDDHRAFDEKARWIVTCNFDEIWIYDQTKPLDPPEKITLTALPNEVHRLSFLVNAAVKKVERRELEISVQAGKIVGTLYDALLKQYAEPDSPETLKALNKLCVRLVFCFYAEDADIFDKNLFRKLVSATPAANLRRALLTLFDTLDTPIENRDKYLEPEFAAFPYTNGGLFKGATEMEIPPLTEEIKNLLISSSDFDWSGIDTTIFGALFESTLNPETRRAGGMVYTSSENIHKLIDPLFLDDLWTRYYEISGDENKHRDSESQSWNSSVSPCLCVKKLSAKEKTKKLRELQGHIASLTFLDPACGSGNFLTETYTSLRRLENRIITTLQDGQSELDLGLRVKVSIDQFHGIEINDFAVTVAQTAMWISEAKMLRETADILHRTPDFLPLKSYNGIVEGNALRMDWNVLLEDKNSARGITDAISKKQHLDPSDENRIQNFVEAVKGASKPYSYIIGNPPFVGASMMSAGQKKEAVEIFGKGKRVNSIDYVGAWYYKAAELMRGTMTKAAFVATNSITQGEQVAALWGKLLNEYGVVIDFAWRTFRWDNESFDKAHVHCVIIGFHTTSVSSAPRGRDVGGNAREGASSTVKVIFDENGNRHEVQNINPYLVDAPNTVIESRGSAICDVPKMTKGCYPSDGGNLILSQEERDTLLKKNPDLGDCVRRYVGAKDFINNNEVRYCLWLKDIVPSVYRSSSEVMRRLQAVREMRLASTAAPTRAMAEKPYLFFSTPPLDGNYLILPEVSSERRDYLPIGFMTPDVIAANTNLVVSGATLYHFGVLISSVHMAWMRTVSGRLKSDYRYSAAIVYNNFPWPEMTSPEIEKTAQGILDARALNPDSSLADLYDPLTMPQQLRKAHAANDAAVLKAYGWPTDLSEPEIVSRLFEMYAKMTEENGNA